MFMLNSTEHEIDHVYKCSNAKNWELFFTCVSQINTTFESFEADKSVSTFYHLAVMNNLNVLLI